MANWPAFAASGFWGKLSVMSAAKEKIFPGKIAAWLAMLFILLVAMAVGTPTASAKTLCTPQNRFWENSARMLQSRPIQMAQSLELQREKSIGRYNDASGCTLAAKSAAGVSTTLTNFSGKVGQATDGVLGGFIKADGTVDFVPFTRNGLIGHTAAQSAGAIPTDAAGGFSISFQDGKVVGYNFQSVLNAKSPNFTLSPVLQQQIKSALSTVTATER